MSHLVIREIDPSPELAYAPDINAHIWRSHRTLSGQLRCGILLHQDTGIEKWAQQAIDLLVQEPAIHIESVFLRKPSDRPSRRAILFDWFHRWSTTAESPFHRVEIRVPPGVPILALGNRDEIRGRIAGANLDVLIWLESCFPDLDGDERERGDLDCEDLARHGVWYFRCGDSEQPPSVPPFWREVAAGNPVTTLALERRSGQGKVHRLAVCQLATARGVSVTRNAVEPLALAGPLLLRNLLDLLDCQRPTRSSPSEFSRPRASAPPGNLEIASLIVREALLAASHRLRALRGKPHWFVALRNKPELFRRCQNRFSPEAFQDVSSPDGSQFADPMVVEDEGRHWLFVEEIPAGVPKGRLAVIELSAKGTGKAVPILERPYHLSYPFVFRSGQEFFLLPETGANNTIELYRAIRFPFEWQLEKVLFSHVRAVDTTPFFLDGIWYLLTTSARYGHETFLFWSKTLDGEWHYHPRNPICSDVRRARGAGPLFRCGEALIRPAQDCSVRYGYAIALNRVLKISPTEYAEELIETIYPDWRDGLLATHTLSSTDALEAIDGLRYSA